MAASEISSIAFAAAQSHAAAVTAAHKPGTPDIIKKSFCIEAIDANVVNEISLVSLEMFIGD